MNARLARLHTSFCRTRLARGLGLATRDYTKFVILGMGRTGSNFLTTSLRSHPHILCYGEMFNNVHTGKRLAWGLDTHRVTAAQIHLRDTESQRFIDDYLFGNKPEGTRAVGFKLFYYHAESQPQSAIWKLLDSGTVNIIHLMRRNYLDLYVSMDKALSDKRWSSKSISGNPEAIARITVPPEQLETAFTQIQAWQDTFRTRYADALNIYYEDLVDSYQQELARVATFLHVENRSMSTPLVKQAQTPNRDRIENYDALQSTFAGTQWSSFFS